VTRKEARDIIKGHAQTRYPNSVVLILLKIVDLTYRKQGADDAGREIHTTTASLMRAGRVKARQWANILKQLKDDRVLLDVEHTERHIACRLDLEPIARLEQWADKHKADRKAYDKKRTEKAREKRAQARAREAHALALAKYALLMEPWYKAFVRATLEGRLDMASLTPDQRAKIASFHDEHQLSEASKRLADNHHAIPDGNGKNTANGMVEEFMEDNPDSPITLEIKRESIS
jgi:hypothetical protein